MRSIIFSVFFLSGAIAACLYVNFNCEDLVDPCEIDAPMEQSQCRAMGGESKMKEYKVAMEKHKRASTALRELRAYAKKSGSSDFDGLISKLDSYRVECWREVRCMQEIKRRNKNENH